MPTLPSCDRRRLPIAAAVWIIVLGLVVGCGDQPTLRRAIYGDVRIESLESPNGSISFFPDGNTRGPAASTAIVAGQYHFTTANGPYRGPHRVVVGIVPAFAGGDTEAGDSSTGDIDVKSVGGKQAIIRQSESRRSPPPAQHQWQTIVEVPSDGDLRINIELPSES